MVAQTAHVDLSSGVIEIVETEPRLLQDFLGGRGLGAALLYAAVDPSIEPFDPRNCLIFTTGPFDATSWPASSRYHVTFKSPATEAYGYANAGGHFGPELRRAGYDSLVVTGNGLGSLGESAGGFGARVSRGLRPPAAGRHDGRGNLRPARAGLPDAGKQGIICHNR